MQRVSALLPTWDRSRATVAAPSGGSANGGGSASKASLEIVRGWTERLPSSPKRLSSSSRKGKEALGPTTLDTECDRAARILKSFCSDGFTVTENRPTSSSTTSSDATSNQIVKRIPPRIIQNAVGLAVFTSMKAGLWTSGYHGSGILLARQADGTWAPPSGLMIQSGGLGFVLGIDTYDCVLVINNSTVLDTFSRPKVSLGTEVSLSRGPLVTVGLLQDDVRWADLSDTVLSYVKARDQAVEYKLEGLSLIERVDENERFYGCKYSAAQLRSGVVQRELPQTRPLMEMLKAAEGQADYNSALLEQLSGQSVTGDSALDSPDSVQSKSPSFGIPDVDDPDPFGVLALEMAGLEIREAGSRLRPDSSQFDYAPSPTSPAFPRFVGRQSVDTMMSQSNRGSYMSNRTALTERSQMTDAGTQTADLSTPETMPSPSQSEDGHQHQTVKDELPRIEVPKVAEHVAEPEQPLEPAEVDYTKIDISALRKLSAFPDLEDVVMEKTPTPVVETDSAKPDKLHLPSDTEVDKASDAYSETENDADVDDEDDIHPASSGEEEEEEEEEEEDDDDDEFEEAEEEPVIFEVATAQPPRSLGAAQVVQTKGSVVNISMGSAQLVQAKGAMVNIPKRIPPPLPTRSPARMSRHGKNEMGEVRLISSPLRQEFELESQVDEAVTPRPGEDFGHAGLGIASGAADTLDGGVARPTSSDERPSTATRTSSGYFPVDLVQDHQAETVGTQTTPRIEQVGDIKKSEQGVSISVA